MAEGGFDDLEMKERHREYQEDPGDEREDWAEDEYDDVYRDRDEEETSVNDDIPKVGRDVGDIKRAITWERKNFFKRYLKTEIRAEDGPASKELLDRTKLLFDKRDRIKGLSLDGTEVLVGSEERGFRESGRSKRKVLVYRKLLNEARNEHERSLAGLVETINEDPTTPTVVVEDTVTQTIEKIDEIVESRTENLEIDYHEAKN